MRKANSQLVCCINFAIAIVSYCLLHEFAVLPSFDSGAISKSFDVMAVLNLHSLAYVLQYSVPPYFLFTAIRIGLAPMK